MRDPTPSKSAAKKGVSLKEELEAETLKSSNAGLLGTFAVVAAFALHSLTEQ